MQFFSSNNLWGAYEQLARWRSRDFTRRSSPRAHTPKHCATRTTWSQWCVLQTKKHRTKDVKWQAQGHRFIELTLVSSSTVHQFSAIVSSLFMLLKDLLNCHFLTKILYAPSSISGVTRWHLPVLDWTIPESTVCPRRSYWFRREPSSATTTERAGSLVHS